MQHGVGLCIAYPYYRLIQLLKVISDHFQTHFSDKSASNIELNFSLDMCISMDVLFRCLTPGKHFFSHVGTEHFNGTKFSGVLESFLSLHSF